MYVILLILSNEEKLPCKFHDIIHVRADVIYSLTLKIAVIQTFVALGLIFHIIQYSKLNTNNNLNIYILG